MTDLILLVFFLLIVLLCTSHQKNRGLSESDLLTKDQTEWIKGVGALMIFLHHLSSRVEAKLFLPVGYLGVGLFLFASGYGLYSSYVLNGKGYAKKLFLKRIPEIIGICLLSCVLNYAFYYFFDIPIVVDEIRWIIFGSRLQNWYFPNAILLYILFGLSIVIGHKYNHVFQICVCFCVEFLLIKFFFRHDIGIHLYISDIAFLAGIVTGRYKKRIVEYLAGNRWEIIELSAFLLFSLLFAVVFIFRIFPEGRIYKILLEILLIIFLVFVTFFSKNKKSKSLLHFIAVHSAEMILVQRISLIFFRCDLFYIKNTVLYTFLTIALQFALLFALSPLFALCKKGIGKIYEKVQ